MNNKKNKSKAEEHVKKHQGISLPWFYFVALVLIPAYGFFVYSALKRQGFRQQAGTIESTDFFATLAKVCPIGNEFNFNNFMRSNAEDLPPLEDISHYRETQESEYQSEKEVITNLFDRFREPHLDVFKGIDANTLRMMGKYATKLLWLCKGSSLAEAGYGFSQEGAMLAARNAIRHQLEIGRRYSIQLLQAFNNDTGPRTFTVFGTYRVRGTHQLTKIFTLQYFFKLLQGFGEHVRLCDVWDQYYGKPVDWVGSSSLRGRVWTKVELFKDCSLPGMKYDWKLSDSQIEWYTSFLLRIIKNNAMNFDPAEEWRPSNLDIRY